VRPARGAGGAVRVRDDRGRWLGIALWSPSSEISLRLLDSEPDAVIDASWWHDRLARSIARRDDVSRVTTGFRLVHAEGDGLPALICDRYDRWLVVQVSAGSRPSAGNHQRSFTSPALRGAMRNDIRCDHVRV
jgi:23S rRNA (cytosine1962-C5)-methyltransferase